MKISFYLVAFLFLGVLSQMSCAYHSEEELYPNTTCDTTGTISYTNQLKPILTSSCNNCHAQTVATTSGGGVILDDYTNLKIWVDSGHLLGSITHNSAFSAMPKGGSKLSDCSIAKFQKWVNNGAPNN